MPLLVDERSQAPCAQCWQRKSSIAGTVPRAQSPSPPAAATPSAKPVPKKFTQPKGLEFTVGTSRAGEFQLGPVRTVSYGHQEIPVCRDGKTIDMDDVPYPVDDGATVLYRPGIYDVKRFGVPETGSEKYGPAKSVIIAGRPGIERSYSYDLPDLVDMRAKLKANEPAEPIRAPYTFGWLPSGMQAISAQQSPADLSDVVSAITIDKNGPSGKELVYPESFYPAGGNLTIYHGKPKPENAPVKGHAVKCADVNGFCTMVINNEYLAEFQKVGKALSMNDIRHIFRDLKLTSLDDQSTWKPVSDY